MDCNFIFVARVGKYLEGMNGRQVLGMKREDLETAFGEYEGKRLDSQITLSRSEDITSSQTDICFYNIWMVDIFLLEPDKLTDRYLLLWFLILMVHNFALLGTRQSTPRVKTLSCELRWRMPGSGQR